MSHSLKQLLRYLVIPAVYVGILYGIYSLVGIPVEAYIVSQIKTAVVKGEPGTQSISVDPELRAMFDRRGYIRKSEIRMPVSGEQYGRLRCERIGIDAPLYLGDRDELLEQGAGQYDGSTLPGFGGTVLVCGHDTTWLAELEDAIVGDVFAIDTEYGQYTYAVREIRIVQQDEIEACQLDATEGQLVLYTCYPFGAVSQERDERYFVYCDQISGLPVEEDGL